jgi:tRNA (cmo5U34)-methyltransferase
MSDNATPHKAREYEAEVRRTIPFHAQMIEQAIDAAFGAVPDPARWLDTGCGPGRLVELARACDPDAEYWLADPSAEMIAVARERLADLPGERFVLAPSEALPAIGPFDVITAVQCHHYLDAAGRDRALGRCRDLLAPGGALVTFENVRADTDRGHEIQRRRWAAWMRAQGRSEEEVVSHAAREGTKFFPIRTSELAAALERAGFATVEVIWRSYAQAGLLAIAPK